jgi:predicted permease
MPRGFTSGSPVDVWTPLQPSRRGEGGGQNYAIVARLHDGVTWAQADAEFAAAGQAAMDDLYRAAASANNRARVHLLPLQEGETQQVRQPILILWAAVAAVLLIGCVNIAGLLMARGVARAPEIATRMELGGGSGAIVRKMMTESLVLAASGGALGIAIGAAASQVFTTILEDAFGATGEAALDLRVLAISSAIALGTSVAFGLLPALQASGVNLRETLSASGSRSIAGAARGWPRRVMVVAEVALGVVLLVGAGLLARSFSYLVNQRAGFDGTHVMTATLSLQDARYQDATHINQLFDRTLDRMRTTPGVEQAAVALTLPYERALNNGFRWTQAGDTHLANMTYVTPGYFETLRVPLLRGRAFTAADGADAAAVVIANDAFVRRYSPDQDPLGRPVFSAGKARTIVGIAGDIPTKALFGSFGPVAAAPALYVPAAQVSDSLFALVHTWFSPSWFVRTTGDPPTVTADMQRAVQAVDPLLPFAKFRTFDEVRSEAVATPRAQAMLLGALAALALLLAAIGLYGLVANSVAERTRELGIRMALGASAGRAMLAAATPGLVMAIAGLAIGLLAARGFAAALRRLIWGVTTDDPLTFVVAAVAMIVVASIAAIVPALRIARLNPVSALRA